MRSKNQPWDNHGKNHINYGIDIAKTATSPFEKANRNLIECHRAALLLNMHYGDFMALKEHDPAKTASLLASVKNRKAKTKGRK